MQTLPSRDEVPFLNLHKAVMRVKAAKAELDQARSDLDQICSDLWAVGLDVRPAEGDVVPLIPLMPIEATGPAA